MTHGQTPARVRVAASSIHGQGLFAGQLISDGQWIGSYDGPVVTENDTYVLWIEDDNGGWTGYDGQNELRYLNHASRPNAEMDGLDCYALRDIQPGEEITIDYGWDEDEQLD